MIAISYNPFETASATRTARGDVSLDGRRYIAFAAVPTAATEETAAGRLRAEFAAGRYAEIVPGDPNTLAVAVPIPPNNPPLSI